MTFDPASNQPIQCVTINVIDDSVLEGIEMFEAVVTSSDVDISIRPFSTATVNINNDDGRADFTTNNADKPIHIFIDFTFL